MLYRNERAHNQKIEAGNVLHTFQKMADIINKNDGTRSFSFRTTDSHDQAPPFHDGQYAQLPLTHPDHFISDVDKGFITFHVKLDLQLTTDLSELQKIDDPNNLYKLFVGFKSSNQIFERLEILHNNVNVGYQQNECIREGFLYSAVKPEDEKKRRRFVHSLWENVVNYSQTISGSYVNLNNFKTNGRCQTEFDLNVPFDDLLAFQAFDLFPNGIIGDLSIRFQVSPQGLVWAVLDPYTVAETKIFLEDNDTITAEELDKLRLIKSRSHLRHQFTQIGNEAVIPSTSTPSPTPQTVHIKFDINENYKDGETDKQEKLQTVEFDVVLTTAGIIDAFGGPEELAQQQLDDILAHQDDIKSYFENSNACEKHAQTHNISPAKKHNGTLSYILTDCEFVVKSLYAEHDKLLAEYSVQPATLSCNRMTITLCKSNMQGYGVCEATRNGIENILREGIIIPSQKVEYQAFPLAAASNGVKSTLNIPLINITNMCLMFPKHHNDLTVFENPVYQNCFLNIDGKNFPDENVSTIGARFFEQQLTANDLDSITMSCTKEFEDSMTMPKNDADGNRYNNSLSDATSFIFNIQTERSSAGYCYDGLDSGKGNVQVQVNGQPIYTGNNDTYYNIIEPNGNTVHPPPVQLLLVRDTYFKLSLEGLEYVDNDTPPNSQVNQ